jgi:hypothetical protein
MQSLFAEPTAIEMVPNLGAGGQLSARMAFGLATPADEALVVRLAYAARLLPQSARFLTSAVRDTVANEIHASPLEYWLQDETDRFASRRRREVRVWWERGGYSGAPVEVLQREPAAAIGEGATVEGQVVLALPRGLQTANYLTLLVDVAIKPLTSEGGEPGGQYRYRLRLDTLYELLHVLYATAVDAVVPAVFPEVLTVGFWRAAGPTLHLDSATEPLGAWLSVSDYPRAAEPPDPPGGTFETPPDADAREISVRDALIKEWLQLILFNRGYTGFEADVERLSPERVDALRRWQRDRNSSDT